MAQIEKKVKSNQDKINSMVLDILEDIIGLAPIWNMELAQKVADLNTYIYFGKTLKQIGKEIK